MKTYFPLKLRLTDILQCIIIALFLPLTIYNDLTLPYAGTVYQEIVKLFKCNIPVSLLLFAVSLFLFHIVTMKGFRASKQDTLLAILFAGFCIIGYLYSQTYTWSKTSINLLRCGLKFLAFFLLMQKLIILLNKGVACLLQKENSLHKESHFLGKHSFRNVSCALLIVWLPIIVLSYPGNLCGDTLMQIWEALGMKEYWAHNPLFVTIILKLFLAIGEWGFGSISAGLFLFSITQCVLMALVLGYSLKRLYERNVGIISRYIIFAVYLLAPAYSNMATTPGKDALYMTLFLLYILCLEEIFHTLPKQPPKPSFWVKFILICLLLCLVRKNGIYIIVPTGLVLVFALIPKTDYKKRLLILLMCCIIPFASFKCCQGFLENVTNAEPGSIREMLSIPFQQSARYIYAYGDNLSNFEYEAISNLLLDANLIGHIYSPDISDPVKGLYNTDATTLDLINYFKAWLIGLSKGPLAYFDAFFQHVYGWFYPGVVNVIRYHATDELITAPVFFTQMRESLKAFYESLGFIPPFSLLENMGAYVWAMFWLLLSRIKEPMKKWLLFPLFFSLLICMASPAFYNNARYGYPILISVPFLSAILCQNKSNT